MILDLNSKYNQSVPAFKSGSNVVIEVLPWLVNQPWNALALAYVTALRPYLTVFDVKSMGYRTLNLATACGQLDRELASMTGSASKTCIDGVTYLQFTNGATVQVDQTGKPVACK